MTESNITKEHEGKHGVLTLGAASNPVTIRDVEAGAFDVLIDGAGPLNSFYLSDGWQFTPDPDPLPTEPGWYVRTSAVRGLAPTLYNLALDGLWTSHYGTAAVVRTLSEMAVHHAHNPLVRVSFGVAS